MKGLVTAFRTLTILPVPGRDAERFSSSLYFFPLVGAVIGLLVCLSGWGIAALLRWPMGAAAACVAVATILTGGLHLDGLADVFDSMGGRTRERKLEIMKDPRIGSFGVMGLVICLLVKFVCIVRIIETGEYAVLILPYVISRALQVPFAVWLPYARVEGTARRFVEGAKPIHFLVAFLLAAVICFAVSAFTGLLVLLLASIPVVALLFWMRRVYGGVTGDLLGMGSETIETLILVGLAVAVRI
jgi:adenosylcobinamide-GDP ribazoletransferase